MAKARKGNAVPANITPVTIVHEDTDTHIVLKGVPTIETPAPVNPVVDAIEDVLGTGGEVTTPVSSPLNPHGTVAGKFNLSQSIRECLTFRGIDTPRDEVLTFIEDNYVRFVDKDFTAGSFSNALSVMRAKMREGNGTTAGHALKVTTVELTDAVKLCQALRMAPAALSALLAQVQTVGSVDAVQAALVKVCELYELMNAGKIL